MKLATSIYRGALRAPVDASHGRTVEREILLLRLISADGIEGVGEAAPLASYDGVTIAEVQAALEDARGPLAAWDGDPLRREDVLAACAERVLLPQALAAIDLALWDVTGRTLGEPVWRLLGAAAGLPVAVNATITAADRAGAAAQAADARAAGFTTVKLKVGIGDDAGRVAAVRAAAGPEMAIRLDANGAWSADEALAYLHVLAPAGIELCEEPVHGLDAFEELAMAGPRPAVAVSLDESASLSGALERRLADAACLKIAAAGGITGVLAAAARARAAGYEVYLASTLDGPLGIAAALHAAAAIAPDRACGLATLPLFTGRPDPLPASAGRIALPEGPGLGDGLLAWYGV